MKKAIAAILTAISISSFSVQLRAECVDIGEDHFFVTKAVPPAEGNKDPTYVSESGGYIVEKEYSCKADKLSYEYYAAHCAQDPGAGVVLIEAVGKSGDVIGKKKHTITKLMRNYEDIYNDSKKKHYKGTIDLPSKEIAKVRVHVRPGNWAVVLSGLTIRSGE